MTNSNLSHPTLSGFYPRPIGPLPGASRRTFRGWIRCLIERSMGGRVSDKRIRVLRVIARMNVGGPALQIAHLMRGLDPSRFDKSLMCGLVGPGEADYLRLRAPEVEAHHVHKL